MEFETLSIEDWRLATKYATGRNNTYSANVYKRYIENGNVGDCPNDRIIREVRENFGQRIGCGTEGGCIACWRIFFQYWAENVRENGYWFCE